ncbi:MAG: BatD family protein, partial [Bacteroidota bacterium]|nr:BatD family protein [Bacteroidota bacterium]
MNQTENMCRKILFILSVTFAYNLLAQNATISIGNTNIAQNEAFTISITLQNEQLRTYSGFPEIPYLQKRGTSSQSSTNIINGQISYSTSIVQTYAPVKQGKFKVAPFTIDINGKKIQNPGFTIVVGPPKQQQAPQGGGDPFADFFGGGRAREFVDVKEDAFFALSTNKDKVFVGEGFTITLAFYVSETNQAQMQFYDIGTQMQGILKKIKPANCWEENFAIDEIRPEKVTIDGKRFDEYKLYRATYYPLNNETVKFPELPLKMIKFKVAKTPSFFGNNVQQDFKTFNTKPKSVYVKDLPSHPLRDQVAVGQFSLEESTNTKKYTTGKSFNYSFKIKGEGNIQAIRPPLTLESKLIDIYPPNIYQDISRSGVAVTGAKNFNYFLVPKEPGKFRMKDFIMWIYFNPKTAK